MRLSPNLKNTTIEATDEALKSFVTMLRSMWQELATVVNGSLGFGDGTLPDNISGAWVNVVTPVAPNTDFTVTHNLARLPVGYWVMQKDRAVDVYTGSVASTKTQLTLRATVASAVIRLFIVSLLLGLIPLRSFAQGPGANHTNIALQTINSNASSGPLVKPIAGAVITVCNGAILPVPGFICSTGLTSIFSNAALTNALPNPTNADINGNYTFWAIPGVNYVVSVSGAGLTPYSYVWTAPVVVGQSVIFGSLGASNLVPGNCVQAGALGILNTVVAPCNSLAGAVTSVSLGLPVQFNVTGSPGTGVVSLVGAWQLVPANYVLGGPTANSLGGIFDGAVGASGNSTTASTTLTPNTAHDWAFVAAQVASAQPSPPTMPAGWTRNFTSGNLGAVFNQVFTSSASIPAAVSFVNSGNWADVFFLLRLSAGSPTIVQSFNTTGAFSSASNVFAGTTAGNSIINVICGTPTAGTTAVSSDTQLNTYTQVVISQNGGNVVCLANMTANIVGGADTVSVTLNSLVTSGFFLSMEVSNLAPQTGEPIFEPVVSSMVPPINLGSTINGGILSTSKLPIANTCPGTTGASNTTFLRGDCTWNVPASATTGQVFSNIALGGNVTINNTATTVATRTVTMPSSGCPCRVFLSYSLSIDFAGVTNQPNIDFWVNDGTTSMAGVETGQSNATTGARTSATYGGFSIVTYTNNTAVTFTLLGIQPGTAGAVVHAAPSTGAGPNSSFQALVITSN